MNRFAPSTRSIAISGRFLSQLITGVQRYAYELLSALDVLLSAREIESIPVTVLVPPDARKLPAWQSLQIRRAGRFTGRLWEQLDLPVHARGSLLFTPAGGAPILHERHVIAIQDAGIFSTPRAYTFAYRSYYKTLQRILTRKAAHIITASEFSRQELIHHLHIPQDKISYAWESGEHILRCGRDDAVLAKHRLTPGNYILAVGSRNPNKNLRTLASALTWLKDADTTLVIAGGSNSAIFSETGTYAGSVKELGFVTDAELRTLYEHAACFVFPSFYEGFGLPPLEALTLGCPVVVARASSLPEIFGDAAIYCDPHSPQDIARQILQVLKDKAQGREAAKAYAAQFTWERCARQTWSILLRHIQ